MSEGKEQKGVQVNEEIDAVAPIESVASTTQAEGAPAASVLPVELTELAEAVRAFGGVGVMMDALRGIKANQDAQRAQMVGRLAANSRCAFERADLEAMTLDQLGKLEASIAPAATAASYAGRNGATLAANADADRFVRFDEIAKKAS